MQHLLILKVLHIGQVISVIWKFWTLEFNLQPTEVLKQQKQTGKKFCMPQTGKTNISMTLEM